jgi:PAS domain S-box-containing protein
MDLGLKPALAQGLPSVDERANARASAYLQAALDAVIMADSAGLIAEFNPAAERLFGYARGEVVGKPLAELIIPPSLRDRHLRSFARFVETRRPELFGRRLELTGMRSDGSEFPVELTLALVDGDPLLVCGAIRDLSPVRDAEADLRRLAEEQTALRRVALVAASEAPPSEVFHAVAAGASNVLGFPIVGIVRFQNDGTATTVASLDEALFPVASIWPLDGPSIIATIQSTARPARVSSYRDLRSTIAARVRELGIESAIGVPIVVNAALWGAIVVLARANEWLPTDAESRLARFSDLAGTAISHMQARDEFRRLADQQAALRAVATLVASGAEAAEVFDAVAEHTGQMLGATSVNLAQFTTDGFNLTVAGWSIRDTHVPTGTRLPLEGDTINAAIQRSAAPARFDSYEGAEGKLAGLIRQRGIRSEVGAPVVVDGKVWGALIAGWDTPEPPPAHGESDIADFAELVGTAVSSAQAASDLRGLLEEQAALRRIATLVAGQADPSDVFAAVVQETGRVLNAEATDLWQYEGETAKYVASWSRAGTVSFPETFELRGTSVGRLVLDTGRAARVDDYAKADRIDPGPVSSTFRDLGISAAIGSPVIVDGRTWGVMSACRLDGNPFPAGAEDRLALFTDLVATAIANAANIGELVRSRARIVTAGDEARRRIEQNLHDGIQQRLVSIGLDLRLLKDRAVEGDQVPVPALDAVVAELEESLEELRDIARGLHPPILAEAGLGPALKALARRSTIPVELNVHLAARPNAATETATYYVVAEALTNAMKHSSASLVRIEVSENDPWLSVAIQDDGIGGASVRHGSGLLGLSDRVTAIGGAFAVSSPTGSGTRLEVTLPLNAMERLPSGLDQSAAL